MDEEVISVKGDGGIRDSSDDVVSRESPTLNLREPFYRRVDIGFSL